MKTTQTGLVAPPADIVIRRPTQRRARETFDLILDTAADLLGRIGVENLSTNAICHEAGVTPPALYRYFSNKYAVLIALGERLMTVQDDAYLAWLASEGQRSPAQTREERIASLCRMQNSVNAATMASPGAAWIMRALRSVPALQHIRVESHDKIAGTSALEQAKLYPHADPGALRIAARLCIEVMYLATEMVTDNPDIDMDQVAREASEMVVRYFEKFMPNG